MSLILFLAVSAVILIFAYRVVGRKLAEFFGLNPAAVTPAREMRDGLDYEPAKMSYLLPQHFSAIAAAGPIVGPILAGMFCGWLPTWLWIILGAILIGGIHDFTTLLASIRHRGRSIAEVVKVYMNSRSYFLFLVFIWISLIYVIIAFADVTAGTFVSVNEEVNGRAVATSSMIYLMLALFMGLTIRHLKISANKAKLIFLPLVFFAIWVGPHLPISLNVKNPVLTWNYLLMVYCFFASIAPLWLLLQPRGDLGGYFLYVVIIVGMVGITVGGLNGSLAIQAPAITVANPFESVKDFGPVIPLLFITVACGACSGFHSIVASGTTSKQLEHETDAKPVAYGGMLLEAFLACISLATVMILAKPAGKPNDVYARGIGEFVSHASFGLVTRETAIQFGLLCFATFVFDTLDACTRLARYILMELTGWKGRKGMIVATLATLAFPVCVLSLPPINNKPLWRVFWTLFGSSNQLLAALALMGVSVWLLKIRKNFWLTLAPAIFMLTMTLWSLGYNVWNYLRVLSQGKAAITQHLEFGVAVLLMSLALWLVVEAALIFRASRSTENALAAEPV